MRPLALLAAALLTAAPTSAIEHGAIYSGPPPARFIGEGAGIVFFVDDVNKLCSPLPGGRIIACSWRTPEGTPVMVLPTPSTLTGSRTYGDVVEHELGHWRGWPGTHPE